MEPAVHSVGLRAGSASHDALAVLTSWSASNLRVVHPGPDVSWFDRLQPVRAVCFDPGMSNGWQMPWQVPCAAGEWRRSTGRAQICAVPPLQKSEGPSQSL